MDKKNTPSDRIQNNYIPTEAFYRQVIDSLDDYAVFTLNKDQIINSWNKGAFGIFGYESKEALGQPFDLIFRDEDVKRGLPQQEIDNALQEGRSVDNVWHLRKDRSLFFAYGLVFPLKDDEGQHIGFVKVLRDITRQKKADDAISNYVKELEELNTHKENILAILSHDLRGPLVGIIGIAEFLKEDLDTMERDEAHHMLSILNTSAKNELNMLDYLVKWARIKYASESFSPTKVYLKSGIEKVFETLSDVAAMQESELRNEVKENVSVFADEKMLHSILQNLVANAIRHSEKGGIVEISAMKNGGHITVQVRDNGVGMSQEMMDKLFTPQVSSLSQNMRENKGAGIGLLLVKGFLERNEGDIWVESQEGEGTSFYFSLPAG